MKKIIFFIVLCVVTVLFIPRIESFFYVLLAYAIAAVFGILAIGFFIELISEKKNDCRSNDGKHMAVPPRHRW